MDQMTDMPRLRQVRQMYLPMVRQHVQEWKDCMACRFGCNGGKKIFFRGYIPAEVLYVGEGAGESEHSGLLPFIGPCGDPMNQIILGVAAKLGRDYSWCITNAVLCSPFNEERLFTTPKGSDVKACRPRLQEFVSIVQPKFIVRVGKIATNNVTLTGSHSYIDIYHPSYMLQHGDTPTCIKRAIYQIHQKIAGAFDATAELSSRDAAKAAWYSANIPNKTNNVGPYLRELNNSWNPEQVQPKRQP